MDLQQYKANSLPRVGGIITSVIQTPLSHVNLRAIQDNVPNAYIKEPLEKNNIANLVGKYIYYKVTEDDYEIREATLEEVNAWYERLRPTEDQVPDRDLSLTDIMPLDDIEFNMSTSFGAKCSNVATMRNFGFPEGTIPNGFGVPFYYYDEFMKYNGFYDDVTEMISDPTFIGDLETRIDMLKDFRTEIKDADMPQWMLDNLEEMHDWWPEGTSIRCRSSTNNEDLPGFSGAGLYTSKTQHPDEGHISKSIKQVYASMWNFRAFDERDFYRIDHNLAAMGVLCHPNYEDEKSNGVGVSIDPIYQTENAFYLNTQVGEDLITNPDANSIPEEIILSEDPNGGYIVLRSSNLVPNGQLVMDESYLNQMRDYLRVIHDEFAILYDVVGAEGFGMDIEYKVTVDDQLIIKQARPWVSFWAEINSTYDLSISDILEPESSSELGTSELVKAEVKNSGLKPMNGFDLYLIVDNQLVETLTLSDTLLTQRSKEYDFTIPYDFSEIGDYEVKVVVSNEEDGYEKNDTLTKVISQLYQLEGSIIYSQASPKCGEEVEVQATISNNGGTTIERVRIEISVNGQLVDVMYYSTDLESLATEDVYIIVTENLEEVGNIITLNLVEINDDIDAISTNNVSSTSVALNSDFAFVTLIINADDYPEETSWEIYNEDAGFTAASGSLNSGTDVYNKEVCLDFNSCYSLYVYDTIGDGICCFYGSGDFLLIDNKGDTLVTNDGRFGVQAQEMFCLETTVSVEEEISISPIKLYPNPIDDNLTVEISERSSGTSVIRVEIYDNVGQLVKKAILVNRGAIQNTISMSELESGSYIVRIIDDLEESNFKVIKL